MTDVDSEIVEDTKNTPLADVTDDSCVLKLIEIVPLVRTADDDHKPGFIPRVVEVKPEDLQDVKQEPADDYNTEDPCFTLQVRSASIFANLCVVGFSSLLFHAGQVAIKLPSAEASKRANARPQDNIPLHKGNNENSLELNTV